MENKFNNEYETYNLESNSKGGYRPMSYEEAVEQRSRRHNVKPESLSPFQLNRDKIMKYVFIFIIVFIAVIFLREFAVHGGIFFEVVR